MNISPHAYNVAAIRNLLKDAFTPPELWRFCQERAAFQPVLVQFGYGASLAGMIDVLTEFCRTQLLFEDLFAGIRLVNPRQYERYQAQLYAGSAEYVPMPHVPHNLPPRTEFIGRESEKARIHEALRSRYFLISIEGIGGMGKTSLALEVAYECLNASQSDEPPEGIVAFDSYVWASARDRDLSLNVLLDAIALTLDYPGLVQRPLEHKLFAVQNLLRDRPCLLLVDNFETVTDTGVWELLFHLPEPSKALITTREQKLSHTWSISLRGLEDTEALALIQSEGARLDLASIQRADERTLLRLHTATGGAPLAIKWAVGQIKQRGQSLDTVLAALHGARGSIFEEVFGRSRRLLSAEARRVLLVMPLFVTSATQEAIAEASNLHHFVLDEAIGQLVEMSLLHPTDDLAQRRYELHPLTRAFATAELGQSSETQEIAQQALERLLAYYVGFVAPPTALRMGDRYWDGTCNYEAAERLRPEWDNLSCLIQWALQVGQTEGSRVAILHGAVEWPVHVNPNETALNLFLPLVHLMHIWGLWSERMELGRAMCAAAQRIPDPAEAWLWIDGIGYLLQKQQQFEACLDALEKGRAAARKMKVPHALLLADAFEVWVHLGRRNLDRAKRMSDETLAQIDTNSLIESPDLVGRIVASRVLAAASWVSRLRHEHDRTWKLIDKEMELRRSVGEYRAPLLTHLGELCLPSGDWERAKTYFLQAEKEAHPKDKARINYGLARVASAQGDAQTARQLGQDALTGFVRLGMMKEANECQEFLASLFESKEHREESGEPGGDG